MDVNDGSTACTEQHSTALRGQSTTVVALQFCSAANREGEVCERVSLEHGEVPSGLLGFVLSLNKTKHSGLHERASAHSLLI